MILKKSENMQKFRLFLMQKVLFYGIIKLLKTGEETANNVY